MEVPKPEATVDAAQVSQWMNKVTGPKPDELSHLSDPQHATPPAGQRQMRLTTLYFLRALLHNTPRSEIIELSIAQAARDLNSRFPKEETRTLCREVIQLLRRESTMHTL